MDFVTHTLSPVYDNESKILMLGSIPSPLSRQTGFYYGHAQNRFWRVLSTVFSNDLPTTNNEKKAFLHTHHIALWDVLHSCEIQGASDASIQNPVPNDIGIILNTCPIRAIFATGSKAAALYQKHVFQRTNRPIITLPSTSPANCRMSMNQLVAAYEMILEYL